MAARGARAAAGLTRFEDGNLHGIGDDVGPVRYKRIPQEWWRSKSRSKLQFIVRKALWTDAILGEP